MTDADKERLRQRQLLNAEMNFYAAERRAGVPPELAYQRAQEFLKREFNSERA